MALRGFRHIGLKVLSLILAALLWLVVSGEQIVERALRIPLEFTNLPPRLELVGEPPTVVDVRVRGSSGALSRVATGELVAVLDLRTARPGQRLFHLTGTDVRAPFGIEVVQIAPSNVSIIFEPSATKVVPIVPGIEGDPADGYVAGTVKSDPATVEVIGPASAVAQLTAAITEAVSIAGATGPVTDMVNIGVTDPSVRLQKSESTQVTVNVVAAPVEWAIAGIPLRAPEDRSIEVTPREVTVFVRGPRETRGSRIADFEASIDVEGLGPGLFELPVRVSPPPRVGVIKIEPPHVRVRVRESARGKE
jgi:YbbR domain-containing protein